MIFLGFRSQSDVSQPTLDNGGVSRGKVPPVNSPLKKCIMKSPVNAVLVAAGRDKQHIDGHLDLKTESA